jgi:kynurenine 3-monooxygenase
MHEINQTDRVTVVGAGLVGSLLSLYLARRGFQVDVLERRPDMRRESIDAGRSINLAISTRGLHALRQVGLEEEALRHAIPMRGRMIHPVSGELAFQSYGKDTSQHINSLSRAWLNKYLMTHAEASGRVRFHFKQRVRHLDVRDGVLDVLDESSGLVRELEAPVVFGTDGSGSAIRRELVRRPGHESSQEQLSHGYKELTIPAGPRGSFRMEKHALHIWPRGAYMLIALPNQDGSFTCTLFLPFQGPVSFESLDSPARVMGFFEEQFPDALRLIPDLTRDFFDNPTGTMVTVKSPRWNEGGRVLLLGDAAHAIVPFFGQGMNCGFEDCVALEACLSRHTRWEDAFEDFFRLRKPNADAIADMAVENFVEMRDKTADPHFLLEKAVEKVLLNAFPGQFLSRYSLVSFSRVPYRLAYEVGLIAGGIVSELSEGLTRAEDVDLERARTLIHERLVPFVKEHSDGFGLEGEAGAGDGRLQRPGVRHGRAVGEGRGAGGHLLARRGAHPRGRPADGSRAAGDGRPDEAWGHEGPGGEGGGRAGGRGRARGEHGRTAQGQHRDAHGGAVAGELPEPVDERGGGTSDDAAGDEGAALGAHHPGDLGGGT